jgi:hypothetical protein
LSCHEKSCRDITWCCLAEQNTRYGLPSMIQYAYQSTLCERGIDDPFLALLQIGCLIKGRR